MQQKQQPNLAQTLLVSYKNLMQRTIYVQDEAKSNTLYTIDNRLRSPQLTFHSESSKDPIAKATIRVAQNVEIKFKERPEPVIIKMSGGWNSFKFNYASPALGGKTVMWKSPSALAAGDLVLLDDKSLPLARLHPAGMVKKVGKIEFSEGLFVTPDFMDEVVVISLTLIMYRLYQSNGLIAVANS
jgi:hypothetical protein